MANIEKRGDSYRIKIYLGRDVNQKKVYKTTTYTPELYTKTGKRKSDKVVEADVRKYADQFEKRVKSGECYSGEKIVFHMFVEEWKNNWAVHNLTPSGLEGYLDILTRRVYPKIGMMKLSDIKTLHIQSIYSEMQKLGRAPKTIKRTHTAINSVMKYAYKMEVIKDNPCDRCDLPKLVKDTTLHYFTLEQSKTFLKALTMEYKTIHKAHERLLQKTGENYSVGEYTEIHTIPMQWQSYFTLAIFGGFRRGEMVALTWEDIDFVNQTVDINKAIAKSKAVGEYVKSTKTKAGERVLKMPSSCFALLSEWKREQKMLSVKLGSQWQGYRGKDFDKNNVFIQLDTGRRMYIDTPSHKFKEILQMYNDSCEKEEDKLPIIRLHDLRHTSATLLLAQNVDIETVSHRMGHSTASVTLDVYGHWMEETDEKASQVLDALFA